MIFGQKNTVTLAGLFAILDIGSSKVCCAIAKANKQYVENLEPSGSIKVVSLATQLSKGIKGGTITDLEALEDSILNAVHNAEQIAKTNIGQVYVGLPAEILQSHIIQVEIHLYQQPVNDKHLRRAFNVNNIDNRQLVHAFPIKYSIDDSDGIRDPRGMVGDKLTVTLHVITASVSYVRNLTNCIGRCHLDVAAFVATPYAMGLSTLVDDELELGAIVIDIGGNSTTIAAFIDGNLTFFTSVPIGGVHITNDIARGLVTPVTQAERLKTLYGTLINNISDDRENILVTHMGEEHLSYANQISKGFLTKIIRSRAEEILDIVGKKLSDKMIDPLAFQRIVLTGGGSQLQGMRELTQQTLGRQVRLGSSHSILGMGEIVHTPAFAVGGGILHYALQDYLGHQSHTTLTSSLSIWQKIGRLLSGGTKAFIN